MKNPKTTSVLVGLGLALLGLAYGYAQGNQGHQWTTTWTNTFINDTGQAVGGLHIQYNTFGFISVGQNPANTFANVQKDDSGQVYLSSGTLAAGGSIQISVTNRDEAPIRNIRKWWWTDGSGILVGEKHNVCRNPDCTTP